MPVICRDIIAELEKLAPKHLAETWDNVGLLLGHPEQNIHKVIVALDVDQTLVNEAIAVGVDLIIAHHPLIFKGITSIRTDSPQGSMLAALIKAGIAVYAAHTNLDSAPGGVNDALAQKLELKEVRPLATVYQEQLHKLVIFVPSTHVEQVRKAITEAGAGHIGNYSHCTFLTHGTGTFLPLTESKPFIGEPGRLEFVDECRLETILPASLRSDVISAMLAAHPYEEVAYDEYLLLNKGSSYGLGRVGRLISPMRLDRFISHVKTALNINSVKAAGSVNALISKVAVCGGSGASLIKNAIRAGADILVTGDVKYHEAQQAVAEGLTIIDAGHFATEQPVVECVAGYLNDCAKKNLWNITIIAKNTNEDVFTTY
ncbi:Nif3-like dinuclear metal center hexameric protein [Sporomusa sp.]|uniref:Nif3-like dinuclear metal center hexameric protein n=1 Tax=Sporomusa sp. TaxID=2078658 RepID=UPI002CF3BA8C|nr:Nif3-like dinuclear metal center hexameric protein [Sporomusa sp.]HWR43887.1 Nif3-like dinuclear metal center hexameric protein [Sporomusa sp.]